MSNRPVVLILGATSAIARGVATAWARRSHDLYLAGRDSAELERLASDLMLRYNVQAVTGIFEAANTLDHPRFFREIAETSGDRLTGVVLAFGLLGDNEAAATDYRHADQIITANYSGAVSILSLAAAYLAERGRGFILGISSVAGDRGRQSNFVYGSAKGAFTLYLQGLRNRLYRSGVHVVTAKLGFVDTRMTFGMPGMFLVAAPEVVGEALVRSVERRKDVVYIPAFWRLIMLIIRAVPERIFKRLRL